ncbi:hypothetical protein L1987_58975 [Smallanthus sonchifolius]|uniref:Uncharacterized protein n=1 Tax=Smallanthus sonchifolius TaxID=185202 RepID=A0ACB9D4H2_9ASTR|nr:hypothetical protein L1987_58975 [Smallanthus sonchifolius]
MFRQWNGERQGRSVERQRQVSFAIDGIVSTNWGKRKLAVAAVAAVEKVAGESGDAGDGMENEYRRRWGKTG